MAKLLQELNQVPEFVVSSDSKRTCQTLELMMEVWQTGSCAPQVDIDGSFYHAPASEWLQKMVELPDEYSNVMFLGHNPGAEELVMYFSGEHQLMPTAAVAQFQLDADQWKDCSVGNLVEIYRPKEI
jgi:phosphohistidine phosphatase